MLIPTLDQSGAEKQFALLAAKLPRERFDVHAIALTRGGPYAQQIEAAGIPVTLIGKSAKFDPLAYFRLRKLLRTLQPQLLHTWLFAANTYGRMAASAVPGMRVVVSERCVDSWKQRWQLQVDRWLLPRTTRLVGNSQSVVDFYREQGATAEQLVCIPNGIDPQPLPRIDRPAMLQQLGFPADAFVAMYIGRLAKQKRVQDLIWAVETLRQMRPTLRLVIVGDGPERQALESFACSVRCAEQIRFVGHQPDPARWLALGDVSYLASSFEGMSNSLMEAMAAGKPVIATDIPPNRELIEPEVTGCLVKTGDTVGFMQYTRKIMDEPEFAARIGTAARERIEHEFSVARMVERYAALYDSLVPRS